MRMRILLRLLPGIGAGAALGWLLYRLFGCTGGCPLSSDPILMTLAGGLTGLIAALPGPEGKGD